MKRALLRPAVLLPAALAALALGLPGCAWYEPDFGVSEQPYHKVSPEWRSREFGDDLRAGTRPPTGHWEVVR
jgi:hypothetical protein